ncbi:MAG: type IV pilus twitching motility protein PilT [Deltaproteobacteria bacterium]|nr:type IV pilus twitching motility protein PilT [Deltaproteobacteria bacterium]
MPLIDSLITKMFESNADAIGIGSGHPVVLVMGKTKQPISVAPLSDARVEQLVKEVLPPSLAVAYDDGALHEFVYGASEGPCKIKVRKAKGLQVVVSNAPADAHVDSRGSGAAPAPQGGENSVTANVATKAWVSDGLPVGFEEPESAGPNIPEGGNALDPYFYELINKGGSDLYICSAKSPIIRLDGELQKIMDKQPLSERRARELLYSITPKDYQEQFEETNDIDFAYEIEDLARFRCNLFMDRLGISGIFRQIPSEILTAEQLKLPKAVLDLCHLSKGLVVVTGPTGSGKSTTLAAMIDYINRNFSSHLITIEDPVEFVHKDIKCVINQREVHNHTKSFKAALRAALREDPDIVLVGEMRDLETVQIAIETAETGHLVFGTLHTNTAPSTVDRIIDQFPTDQQAQIRTMLSESLKGVVAQTLCKKLGGGRVAAQEILIVTHSVSNMIREAKTFQIPSIMQTGKSFGMVTMNSALIELVRDKKIDPKEAYFKSIEKSEMKTLLQRENINVGDF